MNSPNTHVQRQISFEEQSDIFCQGTLKMAPMGSQLLSNDVHKFFPKQEGRTRQVSSITDATLGSTQHSDDQNMGGSGSSPIEKPVLRRNLSNNDRVSGDARSRRASDISGDLNLVNHTHTSASSNELDSVLAQQRSLADKVRKVTFENKEGPKTPVSKKEAEEARLSEHEESKKASHLSPYHEKVANRRSHSYSREPRSPSWNEANFNSSAMSSGSGQTNEQGSSATSEKDHDKLGVPLIKSLSIDYARQPKSPAQLKSNLSSSDLAQAGQT